MNGLRQIVILGATGSVGGSTLDVIARHRDRFQVLALTAHRNVDAMLAQCIAHAPRYAVMTDAAAAEALQARLRKAGSATRVEHGVSALEHVAALPEADAVMAAIVGVAGLRATYAAVRAGKRVLLANKEALVSAGALFMAAVAAHGAQLIPIDSEHNAVFQALPVGFGGDLAEAGVRRIVLTASGGPFLTSPLETLAHVTPEQACAHPNWVMGRKISVDSATMMNKGLEVIEARWLFNAAESRIEVMVHPESIIHSLVEYVDGSMLAQLSNPDMRTPIAFALGYPQRIEAGVSFLDLAQSARLNFARPDERRFPCLRLAREALKAGGSAPTVLNAANEVAVAAFLDGRVGFDRIAAVVEDALGGVGAPPLATLEDVFVVDQLAREWAGSRLGAHMRPAARAVQHAADSVGAP
jgi:1-deoxy-D-xylulose-5-phosphate reductoisomerase